jgi:hypothetical protein
MFTCLIHNYFICLKLTPLLCVVVDEENKKAATFWSCLQDIHEGLQVIL